MMVELAIVCWLVPVTVAWLLGLVRAIRAVHDPRYRVGPADEAAPADVAVSVIVPARDEASEIEACVRSAFEQDHPVEVVVLDDGSTDGTKAVLAGIENTALVVVHGGDDALPPGWLGKPWACQRAARHATGDWLLFIDADVRLAPAAVSRAVRYAIGHRLDLLSGLGTLVNVSLGERVVQPVVAGAILAANHLSEVNDPDRPDKALASGQFLLFRRAAYDQIGGHEAVAGNVLDDVGLALAVKRAGLGFHLVHMRELYSCRMYRSGADAWRGWRKNLFAGVHYSWGWVAAAAAFNLAFLTGPLLVLVAAASGLVAWWLAPVALGPIVAVHALRFYLDGVFEQPRVLGLATHLLGNALFLALLFDSAWATSRGTVRWKGRTIGSDASA
jgi:glycosyltransferase involved in cell wall biosynthesis